MHTILATCSRQKSIQIHTRTCIAVNECVWSCDQDSIELLQARVSALDAATLDQVEARLQVRLSEDDDLCHTLQTRDIKALSASSCSSFSLY